jgi:pimeloyl-ACP methyl ester carboxylesterase
LVVNGNHDIMVPTANSIALFEQLGDAQLSLYPDSGHGALFQHAPAFVEQVARFLAS